MVITETTDQNNQFVINTSEKKIKFEYVTYETKPVKIYL